MNLPKYIGYPGKQSKLNNGFDDFYDKFVDDRIVVATLKPGKPLIQGDANVFEFQNDWESYKGDLVDLGITPDAAHTSLGGIYVVISQLSPISRTFSNNYGDSKIFPSSDILGQNIQDIMQLVGGTEGLEKLLKQKDNGALLNMLGIGVGGYNKLVDAARNMGEDFGNKIGGGPGRFINEVSNAVADLAKSPQSKIGWPKMWRDCNFVQTYQLNTRLYCFSTDNKEDYDNNIKACIGALELFVTPKSDQGVLYTAPYIVQFNIPGMINFPQAYVESMNVIEGGNEGDFAQTGRPNVVDVSMTIQNMYSIAVNVRKKKDANYPARPSVYKDLIGLGEGKELNRKSSSGGGKRSDEAQTITYEKSKEMSDNEGIEAEARAEAGRQQATQQQEESGRALANPQAHDNNESESNSES